jgi:hypothetical protein
MGEAVPRDAPVTSRLARSSTTCLADTRGCRADSRQVPALGTAGMDKPMDSTIEEAMREKYELSEFITGYHPWLVGGAGRLLP